MFEAARPEETLRAISESAVREVAARTPLETMLTSGRRRVEEAALALIRERTEQYRLGVDVVALNLLDVHPPREVVPAYRDVANALEDREKSINEGQAYYIAKVLSAAGRQGIELLSASANRQSKQQGEVTDWTLDDDLWSRLTRTEQQSGDEQFVHLAGQAADILLTARKDQTRTVESAEGKAARFRRLLDAWRSNPKLSGTELYWSTVGETLSSRPLTIIDPKAAGRKHLLLVDPFALGAGTILPDRLQPPEGEFPPPPEIEREP